MSHYTIAILGGGPGGYVAAIKAAQLGAKTILIEDGKLGGVCLVEGCIPTKTLLKSAKVYQDVLNSAKFGVRITGEAAISFDWGAMVARKNSVVRQLTSGVEHLLRENGVEVVNGYGIVEDAQTLYVNERKISTEHLIIATGSRAAIPPIPGLQEGLESGQIVTSTEALEFAEFPKELVIVGGGVVGIEFATLFNALGSEVTVLEKNTIFGSLDKDLRKYMLRALTKKGIALLSGAEVERFEENQLTAKIEGVSRQFQAERVMISLGRKPNLEALQNLGLDMDGKGIFTNERLETSIPGVYAIGDVNGKHMLAHAASAEGITAVRNILGENISINYDRVPNCIYSFPEVAAVGLTEEEAVGRGYDVQVGNFPLGANGKAVAEGEADGFVKIVADQQYGEILGVHIIASQATNLISEGVATLELEGTVHDLAQAIHPHPTFSESVFEAALATMGQSIHFV